MTSHSALIKAKKASFKLQLSAFRVPGPYLSLFLKICLLITLSSQSLSTGIQCFKPLSAKNFGLIFSTIKFS